MSMSSPRAEKVSVSLGSDTLKRAKLLAKHNGVSLSRLVTEAIELLAEEEERRAAGRELAASFPAEARATRAEREELARQWATPHEVAKKRHASG